MSTTAAEGTPTSTVMENMAEEQYVRAKTAVWWDIENCQVPKGLDANTIAQNISSALAKLNYLGPVSISAFGDTTRIPLNIQQALNSTGIALHHVPSGAKDASDKKILVSMFCWALDNLAPANFVLISGDRDFSDALHQLRMRRYNVLLAHPQQPSAPLVNAARSVWLWTSLSAGGSPLSRSESLQLVANGTGSTSGSMSTQECNPLDSDLVTKSVYDNKVKGKYVSNNQPAMTKVQESKGNNNNNRQLQNTQGKQLRKPHEYFGSSEPSVPTSRPPPPSLPSVFASRPLSSLPSSNANPFPGNVMSNTPPSRNQYVYPPRPGPYPPRQLYPSPDPSWNNGNSNPNHSQNYYPNVARPGAPIMCPPYGNGNLFRPYRPGNQQLPNGNGDVYRPHRPENMQPPNGNGSRPVHLNSKNDGLRSPSPPLMATTDISNLRVSQYVSQTQNRPTFNPQVKQEFRPKMEASSYSPSVNGPNKVYLPRSSSAPVTHTTTPATSNTNSSTPGVSPSPPPVVTARSESSNGTRGTKESSPPSEYEQGLIGIILHALNILKTEKVMPTESNISDCIQYGDLKHRGTDVKKALDSAIKHHMITVSEMGKLKLYTGNEDLWECINPLGGTHKQYSKATWEKIKKFLTSSSGRVAIMGTQCRYEAAQVLKKECLKDLTLGDILKILNLTSMSKKWITIHQIGWKPITINLAAESTKTAKITETTARIIETETGTGWKPIKINLAAESTKTAKITETTARIIETETGTETNSGTQTVA